MLVIKQKQQADDQQGFAVEIQPIQQSMQRIARMWGGLVLYNFGLRLDGRVVRRDGG